MKIICRLYRNLTQPAPLDEFDDYEQYWQKRAEYNDLPSSMPRYQIIADKIPDGSSVLDIGCGNGAFLRYLYSKKPNCRSVGADISATAINHLVEQGFEGKTIRQDLPLDEQFDQKFDYVVMMEVIEHVYDAESFTKQAARLTRTKLYITLPNVGFIIHRLRLALCGRFPITNIRCHMKEHIRFWTVKDFREWARHLDLDLQKVIPQVGQNEFFLIRFLAIISPEMFSKSVIYEIVPKR